MAAHDVETNEGISDYKVVCTHEWISAFGELYYQSKVSYPFTQQSQHDEQFQSEKYNQISKLLTEWGLSQYTNIMFEEGWDEPNLWHCIDDNIFQSVLKFKSGHIAKFKSELKAMMENASDDRKQEMTVKLILLGDSRVGKSSVVIRFVKGEFDQYKFPTIGATFLTQKVAVDNVETKFEIWDTAGQEKYRALAPLYYRGSSAALCVYDITNQESFENVKKWVNEVQENEGKHVVIAIAGNKVDLEANRQVLKTDGLEYAKENNFIFYETSAKTGKNVQRIYFEIAREVAKRNNAYRIKNNLILGPAQGHNKKKCDC